MRECDILKYLSDLIEKLDANNKAKQILVIRAETVETLLLNIIGAVNIINRQQAEIERLEHENTELNAENTFLTSTLQNVTASTINEFVDRLKEHKHECGCNYRKKPVYAVTEEKIDNLAKEMAGDTE